MRSGTLQSLDRPENVKFRNHYWGEYIVKQTHYSQASRDVILSGENLQESEDLLQAVLGVIVGALQLYYCTTVLLGRTSMRAKTYYRPYSAS